MTCLAKLALLFNDALTLPADESFELYYRVLIHQGPADPRKPDEEFRQFAATKPPAVRKND